MLRQAKTQRLSCGAKRRNLISGFYVLHLATAISVQSFKNVKIGLLMLWEVR